MQINFSPVSFSTARTPDRSDRPPVQLRHATARHRTLVVVLANRFFPVCRCCQVRVCQEFDRRSRELSRFPTREVPDEVCPEAFRALASNSIDAINIGQEQVLKLEFFTSASHGRKIHKKVQLSD